MTPKAISTAPFVVRVRLDDQDFANKLPAGATGEAAIFTDHVRAAHLIRRVLLRQVAILNYVNRSKLSATELGGAQLRGLAIPVACLCRVAR